MAVDDATGKMSERSRRAQGHFSNARLCSVKPAAVPPTTSGHSLKHFRGRTVLISAL